MSREELRVFLDQWYCGCGRPQDASATLLRILRMCPLFEHREEFEALIPDDGLEYLVLYWFTHFELMEHGGSVGGSWLTTLGEQVRDALAREESDNFETLHSQHCMHGYSLEDIDAGVHACR